ncbi:MAG: signal peptidase I, partial [Eggerthellaceae bacterium]|nr:signal peptidase I [Eggerthellaceae bacterium]
MGLFRRNKGNSNTQEAVQEGAFIVEALKTDTEEKTPHELNDSGENVLDESFEPYRKVGDAPHARTSYKGELAYTKSSWMARHAYEDENKLHQVQQENDELKSQVKTLTTQTSFRRRVLLALVSLIVTSAAVGVLISTFAFPVLRVVGTSMYPTLTTDDMIVVNKAAKVKRGDIVACYLNNRIILKRAIAFQGENVVIDADGNVIVNGQLLEEPYVSYLALGNNDISYPYQVPEGQIFVLGDHRST